MKQSASSSRAGAKRKKFVNDKHWGDYTQPKMVHAAEDILSKDSISEEAFLGAQGVLLLNGIL